MLKQIVIGCVVFMCGCVDNHTYKTDFKLPYTIDRNNVKVCHYKVVLNNGNIRVCDYPIAITHECPYMIEIKCN